MREIVLEAEPAADSDQELGSRIRRIRHSCEIPRAHLARQLHMNVQKLKRLEDGLQNFRLFEMVALARALKIVIRITPRPTPAGDPEAGQ